MKLVNHVKYLTRVYFGWQKFSEFSRPSTEVWSILVEYKVKTSDHWPTTRMCFPRYDYRMFLQWAEESFSNVKDHVETHYCSSSLVLQITYTIIALSGENSAKLLNLSM